MRKLTRKYPLGCLIRWRSPWMKHGSVGMVVGYSEFVGLNGEVISIWLKALMPKIGVTDIDPGDCRVVSKFYSKYKRENNENRKRS